MLSHFTVIIWLIIFGCYHSVYDICLISKVVCSMPSIVCRPVLRRVAYGTLGTQPSLLRYWPSSSYILIIAIHSHHRHTFSSSPYILTMAIHSHNLHTFSSSPNILIMALHSYHWHTFSSLPYIPINWRHSVRMSLGFCPAEPRNWKWPNGVGNS